MKRTVVAAILGLAAVANSYGQGHITFGNYSSAPAYNQVVWHASVPTLGGTAVVDPSVQVQLFFGEGVIVDQNLLQAGAIASINPGFTFNPGAGFGPGGYLTSVIQLLATWAPADVFTFQVRVVGGPPGAIGQSTLWQESAQIASSSGPSNPMSAFPNLFVQVPEPSSLALAGLGLASLLFARRRK